MPRAPALWIAFITAGAMFTLVKLLAAFVVTTLILEED